MLNVTLCLYRVSNPSETTTITFDTTSFDTLDDEIANYNTDNNFVKRMFRCDGEATHIFAMEQLLEN